MSSIILIESVVDELLRHMGYEPTVRAREVGSVLNAEVEVHYGAGALIGTGGEGLNALEDVVRRIARRHTAQGVRIVVDVNGYRRERATALRVEAQEAAEGVKKTGEPHSFAPMHARERRILHLELASRADLITESAGEGAARHVVVRVA